jgi:hypothetical protein
VRRDNRTMAMAIAAARRARPASCPPMRRELSGRVDDTMDASLAVGFFLALAPAPAVGETVGNSPDGLESTGEVSELSEGVPTDVPGSELSAFADVEVDPDVEVGATTSIVALAWKEVALLARAVAVRVIFSPADADLRTPAAATSSSLWLVSKSPTVQTSPLGCEHTVKPGASTCATLLMRTVTVAASLSAPVLHTKIL